MSKIKLLRFINTALTNLFKLTPLIFSYSASAQTATEFNSWWYYVGTYIHCIKISADISHQWNLCNVISRNSGIAFFGYWSFKSAAPVKILGQKDTSLKDQHYYPHDLIHWKD